MCARHLVFVLLIWFPAVLLAQKAENPCLAPQLDDGYLVPEKETYLHETTLVYACDKGYKPAVEGWWAKSTCQNGQWSPKPQCIAEQACLPPTIPNGEYLENSHGWYAEHRGVTVTCHDGYDLKGQPERSRCINGTWPSLPVCEKSLDACDEPPQVSNAVIIKQQYKEVFGANSEVLYECKSGYTTDGTTTQKSVLCSSGNWTGIPSCDVFCVIDSAQYDRHDFVVTGVQYLKKGEKKYFRCPRWQGYYSRLTCSYNGIHYSVCCPQNDLNNGYC